VAQTASKATKGAQRGRLMPVFAWGATRGGTGHRKPRGAARAKRGRDLQESLGPIRKASPSPVQVPSSEVRSEVRARASRGLGGRSISRCRRLRERKAVSTRGESRQSGNPPELSHDPKQQAIEKSARGWQLDSGGSPRSQCDVCRWGWCWDAESHQSRLRMAPVASIAASDPSS